MNTMERLSAGCAALFLFAASIGAADEAPPLTDYSEVEGFQIRPYYRQVGISQSVTVTVVYCQTEKVIVPTELPVDPDELAPLVPDDDLEPLPTVEKRIRCPGDDLGPDDLTPLPILADVSAWRVNGIDGGNGKLGTIRKTRGGEAIYTAPADIPDPNTVTISADMPLGDKGKQVATALVEIVVSGYEGTIRYESPAAGVQMSGNVRWSAVEAGATTMVGAATLDLHISSLENNCSLVTHRVDAGGELSLNFPEDGRYHFTLTTDGAIVSCSGIEIPIAVPWLVCTGWPENPPRMFGGTSLRGSASCDGDRMEWDFHRTVP